MDIILKRLAKTTFTILCVIILSVCNTASMGRKMTVSVGRRITLSCRLPQGENDNKVMWYKGSYLITIGTSVVHDRTHFEINKPVPNELNLVINMVMHTDDDTFICKSTERVISEIDLEVQTRPAFDDHRSSPFTVVMTEGHRGTLECTAVGKPEPLITWYRRPHIGSRFTEIGVTGNILTLHNATRYVNDVFMCNASNVQGYISREMNVTVNFAPDVRIMEDDLFVNTNEQVLVTCLVQGFPLADFYWKKDKEKIQPSDHWKYMIHVEHDIGYPVYFMTLMIRANTLTTRDFGTYTCHADGYGSEAEDKININKNIKLEGV